MPDYTKFFTEAFAKHDELVGASQRPQAQILDINNLPIATPRNMQGSSDVIQKSYEASLHPEKAAMRLFAERKSAEESYNNILKSITEEEFNNLNYLIKNGGYITVPVAMLKSMGEEGETMNTERLEGWGLMKRDKVDSEIIQFTVKSLGRKVVADVLKIMGS